MCWLCVCSHLILSNVLEELHYSAHIEEKTEKSSMVIEYATRKIIKQIKYEGESKIKRIYL